MARAQLILVVEDIFAIKGRGTVVVGTLLAEVSCRAGDSIELRAPDGTRTLCTLRGVESFTGSPESYRNRNVGLLVSFEKAEVIAGTEVWRIEAAG